MSDNEKVYCVYVVKLDRPRKNGAYVILDAFAGSGSYENCMDKIKEIREYSNYLDARMEHNEKIVEPFLFMYE